MSDALANEYVFVKSPGELSSLLSGDTMVNRGIQFVSVLTDIDFDPQTKCHLYFKNFQHGDTEEPDYTCRIICNTTATLNLTRMTLSLFSQQFDLEFPENEAETQFNLEHIHLDKLCFVLCKGALVGRGSSYGIFLKGLRPIDLNTTLFAARDNDMGTAVYEATKTIFDNLVKLNRNSKAQFKFVKLSNLTNEMLRYFQARQESIQLINTKNPMYGAARFNNDHDSVNDFDSQVPDTDPDFNSYAHWSQPSNAVPAGGTQGDSLTNDRIEHSGSSGFHSTVSSAMGTAESGAVSQLRALEARPKTIHLANTNYAQTGKNIQAEAPIQQSSLSSTSSVTSFDTGENLEAEKKQPPPKKQRVSGALEHNIKALNSSIASACTDEILKLQVRVAGIRVHHGSTGPSAVLLCQPGDQELTADSELLCVNVNCVEIEANSVDNIKCGSKLLDADSSESLIEQLRTYCREDKLTIAAKKVPLLLGNGHFTFKLALRSVKADERIEKLVSPPPTPAASQVVVSSNHSSQYSQESRDPLTTFSAISLAEKRVEFVRTFALLVSAKSVGKKMTKFAFTDFTSHPSNTLSAADAFIGTYADRLPQDKAFPFVIYNDHLAQFDRYVREKMGITYKELFNVFDNNLTHQGIVCRLELKVKLYNGGVDGIVRTCEPILAHDPNLRPDEIQFLRSFYTRSIAHIPQSLLVQRFDQYAMFFPITKFNGLVVIDENAHHNPHHHQQRQDPSLSMQVQVWEPPNLSGITANLKVTDDVELPVLATMNNVSGDANDDDENDVLAVFEVHAKVVHVLQAPECLVFHLTNDYLTQDMLDSHRLLRVEIPGAHNIANFYGGAQTRASENELSGLVAGGDQRLTFRLSPFKAPVSSSRNVRIWCPIECSIYELQAEMHVKQEE
ncbi:telomere-binding protein CDC13 LALA0_S12e03290g [Lachancea lanzarotensis]|uniref:LALA0S12e03290g1_1 n=1 Tax=Lachancea lanzarotensis TaxID=1245769 RepID=A0A0C7N398_9SACH|nr:uncharacterized protein LALA0_S12e03290g [Lachancea lanzarotensis]CEP64629.1 LALA0S12e03290g1_1 [Lachancea lanzarotensis]